MPEFRAGSPEQVSFLQDLFEAGLLVPTGVDGVYARGGDFERVRLAFDALVTRAAAPESPEPMYFPPTFPREQLENNGYLGSFPHLAGTVFAFEGDEAAAAEQLEHASKHEDWSEHQRQSEMVLCPAACYSLYPVVAERGTLPEGGLTLDTGDAYVFRREPSSDPSRMQIFHMREIVRVAERDTVIPWREAWRERPSSCCARSGSSSSSTSPTTRSSDAPAGCWLPSSASKSSSGSCWRRWRRQADSDRLLELPPGSLRPHLRDPNRRR